MGANNGGAPAPPAPPQPGIVDEMLSGLLTLVGHVVSVVGRTAISLWAWTLPLLVALYVYARASVWVWWELTLASLVSVAYLVVMYRSGHLVGNWRAHRVRLQLRSAREHVEATRLPRHNVMTQRGRIIGFDVQAHPGWDHEQTMVSVADLLAFYRLSADVETVVTPKRKGHLDVRLVQPVPLPEYIEADVADLTAWAQRGDGFVLGFGRSGPIVLDLTTTPHVMIVGQTGTGKSVVGYSLIAQAILAGWAIVAVDPKRLDLAWLTTYGVTPLVTAEQAATALGVSVEAMEQRLDRCRDAGVSHVRELPEPPRPVLIVVEEATELLDAGPKPPKDSPGLSAWQARVNVLESVTSLARLGRAVDIHLLLMAQRPDASILSGQLRSQLAGRVVVGDAGGPEANRMVEMPAEVAERWEASARPKGRFVARLAGKWVMGQAPFVSMDTLRSLRGES